MYRWHTNITAVNSIGTLKLPIKRPKQSQNVNKQNPLKKLNN
jgi:hypothetical protein